jgi:hypothetical protein
MKGAKMNPETEKKTEETKKGKRYPATERTKLLALYAKLRKAGENAMVAAKKVGVPYITLRTWERNLETQAEVARGAKAKKVRKKAKKVRKARTPKKASKKPRKRHAREASLSLPADCPVTITLDDGVRIECPSPARALKVLKALKSL